MTESDESFLICPMYSLLGFLEAARYCHWHRSRQLIAIQGVSGIYWKIFVLQYVNKVKNADLLSKSQCCDNVNRDLEHFTAEADKWLGLVRLSDTIFKILYKNS